LVRTVFGGLMKPTLIALALTGLLANAAFAEPTLTGDDAYDAVHSLWVVGSSRGAGWRPNSVVATGL
jgi:hypothetical protein